VPDSDKRYSSWPTIVYDDLIKAIGFSETDVNIQKWRMKNLGDVLPL